MANHLPLKLVGETEDSYDFEWDDDALIAHVQVSSSQNQLLLDVELKLAFLCDGKV